MGLIRNSAKTVVVHEGRLLVTRCADDSGVWFCLPGGGQGHREPLQAAARRECMEETGAEVAVGDLMFVLEYLDRRNGTHAVEFYFECALAPGSRIQQGLKPDTTQQGVQWLEVSRLAEFDLRPRVLKAALLQRRASYLGMQ